MDKENYVLTRGFEDLLKTVTNREERFLNNVDLLKIAHIVTNLLTFKMPQELDAATDIGKLIGVDIWHHGDHILEWLKIAIETYERLKTSLPKDEEGRSFPDRRTMLAVAAYEFEEEYVETELPF